MAVWKRTVFAAKRVSVVVAHAANCSLAVSTHATGLVILEIVALAPVTPAVGVTVVLAVRPTTVQASLWKKASCVRWACAHVAQIHFRCVGKSAAMHEMNVDTSVDVCVTMMLVENAMLWSRIGVAANVLAG